jgi:ABC-type Mn2+/Zn2+ transport system permease subunit
VAPVNGALAPQSSWWPAWDLFGDALVTGLLLAIVLPWFGVLLVLRQQLFLAAAIGQAANAGIAAAMAGGSAFTAVHVHGGVAGGGRWWWFASGALAAMLTAVLALRALSARQSTLEARSAWVFLVGGAGAMLVLAEAPHGLQELQRLFLSSLLAAGPDDPWLASAAVLVVGGWLSARPRQLLAWALEPRTAAAHGGAVFGHDVLVGALLGLVFTHAILATGLMFTFGATVLPVLAARELASSLRSVVLLAPTIGALGQALAFAVAHRADLPPGQVAVVVFGAVALLARGLRLLRST